MYGKIVIITQKFYCYIHITLRLFKVALRIEEKSICLRVIKSIIIILM